MRNAWLVAAREYFENVRTKGFWIGIAVFPIMIYVSLYVPKLLDKAKPTRNFVVIDQSKKFDGAVDTALERLYQRAVMEALGKYATSYAKAPDATKDKPDLDKIPAIDIAKITEKFQANNPDALDAFVKNGLDFALAQMKPMLRDDAPKFEKPKRPFLRVPLPEGVDASAPADKLIEELKPYLRGEKKFKLDGADAELFSAVIIPNDIDSKIVRPGSMPMLDSGKKGVQYWSSNLADSDLKDEMERSINDEQRRLEYVAKGTDLATVTQVQRTYVPFSALNPKKEAGSEMVSLADQIRQWAPAGFVYLLWISIFSIAQMLLNNTIEEKSNRLIEVLLSSVTPGELMLGKLCGVAAVGLTMLSAWMIALITILKINAGPESELATQLLNVLSSSGLIPAFVGYFALGYFLYAGVFVAIGSVCNTLKEAQNMMQPVVLIMIVPLMTMMFIPKDPNGPIATALSWVPIYTPFVMMNRAAASPPTFELVGTTVLLVATTIGVAWAAGKIFRIGVLRTGQPPKLLELVRWLRTS